MDDSTLEVESGHLGQLHRDVRRAPHDMSERRGDLDRGEDPCRDQIEEWLEEVMIAPVDEGDTDRTPSEQPRGRQASESSSDDGHSVAPSTPAPFADVI